MKKITNTLIVTSIVTLSLSTGVFAGSGQTTPVNDSSITNTIQKDYSQDKLLHPFDINVSTTNGIVNLSGQLDTDMQYQQAVSLAESTDGVADVKADNLTVKDSKSPLSDTYITAKIDGLLLKGATIGDKDVKFTNVNVETTNGVVYLSGTVENKAQINNIIEIANRVDGVKSVKSVLKVK